MKIVSYSIFKKSWLLKTAIVFAVMLCLGISGFIYVRYQVQQWLEEQNATIEISSYRPSFSRFGFPSLAIGKTTIKFKSSQTSLEKIEFDKAIITLDLLLLLKRFVFAVILQAFCKRLEARQPQFL